MQQERYLFIDLITAKLKNFYGHRQTHKCLSKILIRSKRCWWFDVSPTDGYYRQVKQISGAHNKAETNPAAKAKKRRGVARGMAPSVVRVFNHWPLFYFFFFYPKYCNVEGAALKIHVIFAGYPAERHCSSLPGSAHPYLRWCRRWVRSRCCSGPEFKQIFKKNHAQSFIFSYMCQTEWLSSGTWGRTTRHTIMTLFHCRYSRTRVLACARGSVSVVQFLDIMVTRQTNSQLQMTTVYAFYSGYSGIALDSTRSNIICNCTDDNIYMFNVCGVKTSPGKGGLHSGCCYTSGISAKASIDGARDNLCIKALLEDG